jgi:O-antigen ligase
VEGPATLELEHAAAAPVEPARGERLALRVVQAGAVAVVLAATTWKVFELDRFFVPKELVLHLTALLALPLVLGAWRRSGFGRADWLLLAFLGASIASAAMAVNPWLGARAVAITASGLALFWAGRGLAGAGLGRHVLGALALAVVLGAATALLQAYGVRTDFFSLNRAPGGTFGNRNFVAHLAAFGLPIVLVVALSARTAGGYLAAAAGSALVTGSLILTRSRAGWLAFAAVVLVLGVAMLAAPALRRHGRTWLRLGGILLLAGGGVVAAVTLPNNLRWRSDSPYLESVRGVANYQDGSGRGRLIQYRQSLAMTAREPLLGVGPGNWAVAYPEHAAAGDPSMDRSTGGMTSNPWPSSDWVAFLSERGVAGLLLLALALALIARAAFRRLRRTDAAHDALCAAALLAVLAATLVAGLFDAVLLLAVPAFIVWTALGALHAPAPHDGPARATALRTAAAALVLLVVLGGAARSAAQLTAIGLYAADDRAMLRLAARIDPGNYRVRLALAGTGGRADRCRHAQAAHALFPTAAAAARLQRRC